MRGAGGNNLTVIYPVAQILGCPLHMPTWHDIHQPNFAWSPSMGQQSFYGIHLYPVPLRQCVCAPKLLGPPTYAYIGLSRVT